MVNIGRARRIERVTAFSVVVVLIGLTTWLWPSPDVLTQVGPTLPTLPTLSTPSTLSTLSVATSPRGTTVPMTPSPAQPISPADVTPASTVATTLHPPSARATDGATSTPRATSHPPSRATVVAGPGRRRDQPAAVPASISVPFGSTHHPDGVQMTVLPHGPSSNGDIWIPGPEEGIDNWADDVSWLNTPGFAAPFSPHGAVIIAGHINWNGTSGALSDLSEYGADDIGRNLTVTMTDGRIRTYRITSGFSVDKKQLAAEANQGPLHTAMFGQNDTFGPPGNPSEELRLISCGGRFDPATGNYTSNIIISAEPIS